MGDQLSNTEILSRLDGAFKAVTDVNELGASVLATQKFDRFVREARDATVLLPETRFLPMASHKTEIDRIGFTGRVLRSGLTGTNSRRVLGESEFADPTVATNALNAVELQAITSLRDAALRRNIERQNFDDTLVDLFGQAAGRDLEEFALLADTGLYAYADDDVLSQTDGWLSRAANKLYGQESGAGVGDQDFDPADPESIFESMLGALPKRFIGNPAEWRFYTNWSVRNSYVDVLRARGTVRADSVQEGPGTNIRYKGIPVVYVPGLERAAAVGAGGQGATALLSHPDNMVWGVFHDVTIEPEREAKGRRTDFVLTVEADADYEDENAAVAAYIDSPNVP